MRKGTCKIIKTPGGRRKLCRQKNGRVKFVKMGKKKKKSKR